MHVLTYFIAYMQMKIVENAQNQQSNVVSYNLRCRKTFKGAKMMKIWINVDD